MVRRRSSNARVIKVYRHTGTAIEEQQRQGGQIREGGVAAEREPWHELLPLRYSTGRWVSGMWQAVYVCVCGWGDNI